MKSWIKTLPGIFFSSCSPCKKTEQKAKKIIKISELKNISATDEHLLFEGEAATYNYLCTLEFTSPPAPPLQNGVGVGSSTCTGASLFAYALQVFSDQEEKGHKDLQSLRRPSPLSSATLSNRYRSNSLLGQWIIWAQSPRPVCSQHFTSAKKKGGDFHEPCPLPAQTERGWAIASRLACQINL